ncbi:hypothetical protein BJY52DRAFT_1284712 [Lactarius psammicola]|nr:hypothetical protein BJY52DRAFT_1284712 [Lactarius psammicola]
MNGYDPFTQAWGNTSLPTSNGAASFDHNVASSHVQSQSLQQHGAPIAPTSYTYPKLNQIAAASEAPQHAAAYPALISPVQVASGARTGVRATPQFTGSASGSTSRDSRRGHQQPAPQTAPVSPQLNISGPPQDYHHLSAAWTPAPSDISVSAGRPSRSHGRQPGVDYNLVPSSPSIGQQRRSSSQHYDPPSPQAPAREGTRLSVDAGPGTQQRCIIPGCQYGAYYNVTEEEQMEYCGHGHELQAIETGFAKPCAMCKRRPRRSGERVCGRVCREQQRQALQVQGTYYGVNVTRREPQTRPR